MSLDTVELVMEVEDEFGIRIPDDDACEIAFVGQLVQYVADRCPRERHDRCPSAQAFYKLRRAVTGLAGAPRHDVRPSASLADLVPVPVRRALWRELDSLGFGLPALRRPAWTARTAAAMVVMITAAVAWVAARAGVPAATMAAIACGGVAAYAARWLTRPAATLIPEACSTVADAVHCRPAPVAGLSRSDIAYRVRVIIADQMGMSVSEVTEDKHFVDDLNMD